MVLRGGLFPRLIALFPLLFPLYLVRGPVFGIPVTLPELIVGFAFLFFLMRERPRLREFWVAPVWIFCAAAVLSTLIVPYISSMVDGTEFPARLRALGILKGWIFAPILYFWMARFYFREKPSLIPMALRALVSSGMILSVMALYQVWTGEFTTPDGRASGPFESANYLALYLGPLFTFAGFALMKEKETAQRIFCVTALLLIGAALYFTDSYAAWLSVIGTFGLAGLLFVREQSLRVRLGMGAVMLVLGVVLVLSQLNTEKGQQFFEFDDRSSSSVRVQVYDVSLNLLKENPLLGIGLGQYEQVYQTNATRILGHDPFEWVMIHPHNLFLALWLNLGLIGFCAFLWLMKEALPWLLEKDKKERRIAALMLVTILIHGLFDTPMFKNDLAFEFWLLLAMLI